MPWSKFGVQPLCRTCGKPIAKVTEDVWFGENGMVGRPDWHRQKPRTLDEAKRLCNMPVISHRWSEDAKGRFIGRVALWDGESYRDSFFCTVRCGETMGRAAVLSPHNLAMPAYNEAIRARAAR